MSAHSASAWLLIGALAAALCGCGKKQPAAGAAPSPAGATAAASARPAPAQPAAVAPAGAFQKPLVEGLQKAGFSVGALETTAAQPYQARSCVRGEVSKLDVMSCQYDSEQNAELAKASLERFVAGAGTGAVRRSGTLVLAVADRGKIDPRGKLVDKMLKTFSGLGLR